VVVQVLLPLTLRAVGMQHWLTPITSVIPAVLQAVTQVPPAIVQGVCFHFGMAVQVVERLTLQQAVQVGTVSFPVQEVVEVVVELLLVAEEVTVDQDLFASLLGNP
jgi:hypothetical protein